MSTDKSITARDNRYYGYIPDLADHRDLQLTVAEPAKGLPASMDLRPGMPPVYDQEACGSCTGNAIAGAIQYEQIRQGLKDFTPSRLFIYYCERKIEGTIKSDSGAQIRDGIKVIATIGAPPETDWAYDIKKFTKKPPVKAFQDAALDTAVKYQRVVQTIPAIKSCIASGLPIVFGFTVYESFESDEVAKTGILNMPTPGEKVVGGHAVVACGYDDARQAVLVRNSWAADWGMEGYFWMPYAYISSNNLADDLWNISLVK